MAFTGADILYATDLLLGSISERDHFLKGIIFAGQIFNTCLQISVVARPRLY